MDFVILLGFDPQFKKYLLGRLNEVIQVESDPGRESLNGKLWKVLCFRKLQSNRKHVNSVCWHMRRTKCRKHQW
jgi:hypothetical protein